MSINAVTVKKMTNRNIFRQSNVLINAKYKISAVSLDIFLMILTEINSRDKELKVYRFKISDIEKRLSKRLDRRYLSKISNELRSYGVTIEKEDGGFLDLNLLSSFEYLKKEGAIELEISSKIKPYVLDLKERFTKASLYDVTAMQSEYSKRLFLMFEQRKNLGEWTVDVDYLQDVLCISKSMKPFGIFNREVIKVAIRDINKSSSIEVELVDVIKNGRTVVSLVFKIRQKKVAVDYKKDHVRKNMNMEEWDLACAGKLFNDEEEIIDVEATNS